MQKIDILLLFIIALAIRSVFALQWAGTPYGDTPLLDAQIYDQWAQNLAAGIQDNSPYYQSPLYPWILSLLYRVYGHSLLAASLLNSVLDAGTVLLAYATTQRIFGRAAAIAAGLFAAFYEPMIFFSAPPMKEPLTLFLLSVFVWTALQVLAQKKTVWMAASGFTLGLVVVLRGNALLLLPAFFYVMWRRKCLTVGKGFIYSIAFCAAILPVTLHNWSVAHDFVPLTSDDGFNLYIGHSPYAANGTNTYPPEVSTDPNHERLTTTWEAEKAVGHSLRPSEISAYWRDQAIAFALHHPLHEAQSLVRKFFAFLSNAETFDNYDPYFIRHHFRTLLNLPLPGFSLLMLLAVFGYLSGLGRRNVEAQFLMIGAVTYMASVLIFYVTDRYRLPVVVFLFPLAGAAVVNAKANVARFFSGSPFVAGSSLSLALMCGASYILMAMTQADRTDLAAFDWGVLTGIYADHHQDEQALAAFQRATVLSPTEAGSQAYIRAAEVYNHQRQFGQAQDLLRQAATLFPQDGIVFYSMGRQQTMSGDRDAALLNFEKARALDPTYALTYYALAKLHEREGNRDATINDITEGLAIDPQNALLLGMAMNYKN